MSDLTRDDQALLRQAETQRLIEAAIDRVQKNNLQALAELRELLEKRFSMVNEDFRRLRDLGVQITYVDRDLNDLRRILAQQSDEFKKRYEISENRITSIEHVQATRATTYEMMQRMLIWIVLAFFSAVGGIVYIKSTG